MRQAWLSREDALPLLRQCALAGVSRATYYAHHQHAQPVDEEDTMILRLIDEEYTRHPFLAVAAWFPFSGCVAGW